VDQREVDLGTTDPMHHLVERSQNPHRSQTEAIIILGGWLTTRSNTAMISGARLEDPVKQ
jgi:hypothetical protein